MVPYYNYKLELRTIQTVSPKGEKRFLPGGQKKGCFSFIGSRPSDKFSPLIYIVEGFCTGASVYIALHLHDVDVCVIVAGDAGNLKPVAIEIKMLYPNVTIIIAGDNDSSKEVNIGLQKAREASQAIGGVPVIVPRFSNPDGHPSDWNDLHCREGIEEVYAQLTSSTVPRVDQSTDQSTDQSADWSVEDKDGAEGLALYSFSTSPMI